MGEETPLSIYYIMEKSSLNLTYANLTSKILQTLSETVTMAQPAGGESVTTTLLHVASVSRTDAYRRRMLADVSQKTERYSSVFVLLGRL